MAFECPHCHFRNSEIQAAGAIQEKGCVYTCHVKDANDLNRQIVRSEWATVSIPALEFEVPPTHEHGSLTTIEGFITNCINDLELHQPARKLVDPETHDKIEAFIARLRGLLDLTQPFDLILDDPSGNSYIENLCGAAGPPQPRRHAEGALTHQSDGYGASVSQAPAPHGPAAAPQAVRAHHRPGPSAGPRAAARGGDAQPGPRAVYAASREDDRMRARHGSRTPRCSRAREGAAAVDESIMVFPGLCSHCGAPVECKMHPIGTAPS